MKDIDYLEAYKILKESIQEENSKNKEIKKTNIFRSNSKYTEDLISQAINQCLEKDRYIIRKHLSRNNMNEYINNYKTVLKGDKLLNYNLKNNLILKDDSIEQGHKKTITSIDFLTQKANKLITRKKLELKDFETIKKKIQKSVKHLKYKGIQEDGSKILKMDEEIKTFKDLIKYYKEFKNYQNIKRNKNKNFVINLKQINTSPLLFSNIKNKNNITNFKEESFSQTINFSPKTITHNDTPFIYKHSKYISKSQYLCFNNNKLNMDKNNYLTFSNTNFNNEYLCKNLNKICNRKLEINKRKTQSKDNINIDINTKILLNILRKKVGIGTSKNNQIIHKLLNVKLNTRYFDVYKTKSIKNINHK